LPGGGPSQLTTTASPMAIVALVILLGACAYLWRIGYMRSRAALITVAAVCGVLIYIGFFAMRPPT
jgi:hypothetical protein